MNGDSVAADWLRKAASDLLALDKLTVGEPVPWDIVCFHAQQAAEKSLKAALIARGLNPPRTHDLLALVTLCDEAGIDVSDLEPHCRGLVRYAVASRYPDPVLEPDRTAGQAAIASARMVSEAIRRQLPRDG